MSERDKRRVMLLPGLKPDPSAPARRTRRVPPRLSLRAVIDGMAKVSLIGLFVIALTMALEAIGFLAVPVTLALITGLMLGPVQQKLEKRGMAPMLAAGLLLALVVAVLYGLVLILLDPIETWLDNWPTLWAALQERLTALRVVLARLSDSLQRLGAANDLAPTNVPAGWLSTVAFTLPALVTQLVLYVGSLFFYLSTRTRLRESLLRLCFSRRARLATAHILRDMEYLMSAYLGTITLINMAFGAVIAFALWLLGMPTPVFWGALAALFNYALYLGPVAFAGILFAVALAVFESAWTAALIPLVYLGLNAIEGNFITPALVGHRMSLNPLLVFVSVAFWYWLWGPMGGLIAVPIAIIGAVILGHTFGAQRRAASAG